VCHFSESINRYLEIFPIFYTPAHLKIEGNEIAVITQPYDPPNKKAIKPSRFGKIKGAAV